MELKEFISETVSAIADATTELQLKYGPDDIVINPPSAQSGGEVFQKGSHNYTMRRVQNVDFDVAVTVASDATGGAKAGIKVFSAELAAHGGKSQRNENVTRVSFSIPMTLKPSDHEIENTKKRNDAQRKQNDAAKNFRSPSVV